MRQGDKYLRGVLSLSSSSYVKKEESTALLSQAQDWRGGDLDGGPNSVLKFWVKWLILHFLVTLLKGIWWSNKAWRVGAGDQLGEEANLAVSHFAIKDNRLVV